GCFLCDNACLRRKGCYPVAQQLCLGDLIKTPWRIVKVYLKYWLDVLRTSLWFVPTVLAATALLLAMVLVWVDSTVNVCDSGLFGWLCASDADAARQLLVVIGGSMLTIAGVTFSITIVALSMASAQFGPRLLRNYMRDRGNQIVLGTFIADFVYCLTVLRYVSSADTELFVPYLAVNFSMVLAFASLAVLIYFFHHVSSIIQADSVVAQIGSELSKAIDEWAGDTHGMAGQAKRDPTESWSRIVYGQTIGTVRALESGYIQSIDYAGLMELAERHDICMKLDYRPGHFVIRSSALLTYTPALDVPEEIEKAVCSAFILGRQRSPLQDIEFLVDQIGQVAARALSPYLNDPYTAIACVDWLSAGIARLAVLDFPSPHRYGTDGRLRLIADTLTFKGVVNTAFDELRQDARPIPAVTLRLLEAIAAIVPHIRNGEHLAVLQAQADMIEQGSESLFEETDRREVRARHREALELLAEKRSAIEARGQV
ncbi:MAG: DUF2254 domain-containing protein, partial [Nitrosospira sp.]|nr:DUF2254 domain-containing protein [Nitrosospira sp.]